GPDGDRDADAVVAPARLLRNAGRVAGGSGSHPPRAEPGAGSLRWGEAAARPRRRPGRPARTAVPRRTDDRPRPALARTDLGGDPPTGARRRLRGADHP